MSETRNPTQGVYAISVAADLVGTNIPYVFTDTGQTVATGREVYGYPKQLGKFAADYPGQLVSGLFSQASGLSEARRLRR